MKVIRLILEPVRNVGAQLPIVMFAVGARASVKYVLMDTYLLMGNARSVVLQFLIVLFVLGMLRSAMNAGADMSRQVILIVFDVTVFLMVTVPFALRD